ncbi:protein Aatf [Toxorhynchites rutilus septentrionalis]|uniref:protein Aatf n=1 Tax=Toxorhynchites rutilus septentrionalis TaxID=329112 RepID=UPI00247A2605|nr:protein Aatf [Toxorhynchites rutilus septentrionalis]
MKTKKFNIKRRSAPETLSDKIHAQFQPKPSRDVADDSGDEETRPKFSEFEENDAELERAAGSGLSEIRKRNIEYLDAVDRKYQGQISSRREVFESEEDEKGSDDASSEAEESSEDDGYQPGAFVKLKQYHNSEEAEADDREFDEGTDSETYDDDAEESDDDEDEENDEQDEDDVNDISLGDLLGKSSSDSQKFLQDENQQESVQKGICVQNQLKIWERLLEMRIKMQPCLVTANALPREDKFHSFSNEETFREATQRTVDTVESTLQSLLQLQETLAGSFPETKDLLKVGSKRKGKGAVSNGKSSKNVRLNDFELRIGENFANFKPYRNDVLQRWDDRAKASSNVKNVHQSLSVIKKIENGMLAKDELIRKTQLYRGGYELFAKPAPEKVDHTKEATDCGEEPEPVYDEEIYDDSDFYHALLRELIEYKSNVTENPQEINAKLAELQKLRSKMKKQVDTRASKGRKIRYVVHKKLVNFTAPDDKHEWTEEAKNELFASLFGGTNAGTEG